MGILKDHISIISFLKPGIIIIQAKSGEEKYYVEDGIIEFKNNTLSILTSYILNLKNIEKSKLQELLKNAEEESNKPEISDQLKYLADQKVETLKDAFWPKNISGCEFLRHWALNKKYDFLKSPDYYFSNDIEDRLNFDIQNKYKEGKLYYSKKDDNWYWYNS